MTGRPDPNDQLINHIISDCLNDYMQFIYDCNGNLSNKSGYV